MSDLNMYGVPRDWKQALLEIACFVAAFAALPSGAFGLTVVGLIKAVLVSYTIGAGVGPLAAHIRKLFIWVSR